MDRGNRIYEGSVAVSRCRSGSTSPTSCLWSEQRSCGGHAKVTRVRQLDSGIAGEGIVQLPIRNTNPNLMLARRRAQDVADGRAIRERAGRSDR